MRDRNAGSPPHILLVEDNPDDVFFIEEIFEKSKIRKKLHVVGDGDAALRFLRRQDPYTDAPRPSLIILDLKLPKIPGMEVLERIKDDDDLRAIPVIVLTTSDADLDAAEAYDLHATSFLTKPRNLDDFGAMMERLQRFWLDIARLPGTG